MRPSFAIVLQLTNCSLFFLHSTQMPPKEKEERYDFSFDGVSGGEPYRAYRAALFNEGTGTTDE